MMINQSLSHGLQILLLYDPDCPYLSVAEIKKRLHFSQSKVYRLLRALIQHGFIEEKAGRGQYGLGLSALQIGLLAQRNLDLAAIARPFMKELSALSKESVLLTAVSGTKGVCVESVESEEPIRSSTFQPGERISLHSGASGKILMAYLTEEDWDRIISREGLKRFTPNTITEPELLKSHLREIRRKGYAISDREVYRDVRAVGAPVLNGNRELVAGLSIVGPFYRISKKRLGVLVKLAVEYANRISGQLGYVSSQKSEKKALDVQTTKGAKRSKGHFVAGKVLESVNTFHR